MIEKQQYAMGLLIQLSLLSVIEVDFQHHFVTSSQIHREDRIAVQLHAAVFSYQTELIIF